MTTKTLQLKMAKATDADVEAVRNFFLDPEMKIEDWEADIEEEWIREEFNQVGHRWQRVVEGYPILRDNVCDPNLDYLEWKPELKTLTDEITALKFMLKKLQFVPENSNCCPVCGGQETHDSACALAALIHPEFTESYYRETGCTVIEVQVLQAELETRVEQANQRLQDQEAASD